MNRADTKAEERSSPALSEQGEKINHLQPLPIKAEEVLIILSDVGVLNLVRALPG